MSTPLLDNRQLGPDVARANLLTNGGFEIWQRGNGPYTSGFCADRWAINPAGTDTLSVSKDTTNMDTALGSNACAACTFTLGTGAGATQLTSNGHALADGQQIANRPVSLSARVRTTIANAVRIAIYSGTTYTYSNYHSGSGNYETLTVTLTLPAASTGPSLGQVGVFFSATCTAYVDNACLVVGSQPADYVPLHPADDLARCLRYYEVIGEASSSFTYAAYCGAVGNTPSLPLRYIRKAAAPTVTIRTGWTTSIATGPSVQAIGYDVLQFYITATAVGLASVGNNAGGAILIEANP